MVPLLERLHQPRPMIVGHRGSPATSPENTTASIRQAVDAGAEMIELDAQLTRDDRVVICHDRTLKRTTSGRGVVSSMSYPDIARHDAGSWFHRDFATETVPLLETIIETFIDRTYLNIELKSYPKAPERAGRLVARVVEQIARRGIGSRVIVSSFDHDMVALARSLDRSFLTAPILHPLDYSLPARRALAVGGEGVVLSRRRMTRPRVADARAAGLAVLVYTLDQPRDILRAAQLGVSGIITNNPASAVALLAAHQLGT